MGGYVTHLEAAIDGTRLDANVVQTMHKDRPLWVRYDLDAVRRAAEGTGLALVASALSSVVGFLILALAPMPLFASYGLLTAVMIALALTATLLVLPSLLVATTQDATRVPTRVEDPVPA